MNIEANGVAVDIAGSQQRRAAAHKRVNHQFALMREEFDAAARQRNGKRGRMLCLVPNIAPLIAELPDPKLTLDPLLWRQAVQMGWWTLADALGANRELLRWLHYCLLRLMPVCGDHFDFLVC